MEENMKENLKYTSDLMCNEIMHNQETDESLSPSSKYNSFCCDNSYIEKNSGEYLNGLNNRRVLEELTECGILNQKSEECASEEHQCSETDNNVPLPLLSWANNIKVWKIILKQEKYSSHAENCYLYKNGTILMPHTRAKLLVWVTKICEHYKLRRTTYHLTVDYVDRYLAMRAVPNTQLQLLMVTSLFIASKVEEIYPPNAYHLSYKCDESYHSDDILEFETIVLQILNWDVNPLTAIEWLNLYMQIYSNNQNQNHENKKQNDDFLYTQYSGFEFLFASHLIDLFTLDLGFVLFRYNVIAATAMFFLYGKTVALEVSKLNWEDIKGCAEYMAVFHCIIKTSHDPKFQTLEFGNNFDKQKDKTYNYLKVRVPRVSDEHHIPQTSINIQYFEEAIFLQLQRMGFCAHPVYIKIKMEENHLDSSNEDLSNMSDNDVEVLMEEPENRELYITVLEVKKITLEEESETISNGTNKVFDFLTSKTRFTYDEILIEINKFNKEMFLTSERVDTE